VAEPLGSLTPALADRYRLENPFGQGGMAMEYLAEDSAAAGESAV
jgi:hypothetical protein